MTGGRALLETLTLEGIDTIFGYPGGAILPIYDELHKYDKLRHILVRHEQGAAMAAEGYAKVSRKIGVCFATSGPGATNLVTGIADAMLDSVPLLCITGQVTSSLLGTDAFQESDIIGITIPITKWCYQVTDAKDIPRIISKAIHYATTGRPGPVLVDITKDAQAGMMEFMYKKYTPSFNKEKALDHLKLNKIAEIIANAKKPYILAGNGVNIANAEDDLLTFAEKIDTPVACTLHGLSSFPMTHHLYAGLLGMHGNYGPNMLTNQADVIIAIGMRFDDRVTGNLQRYAKQAKIIHIDVDNAELNKNVRSVINLVADAKVALTELIKLVKPMKHEAWRESFNELYRQEMDTVVTKELTCLPDAPIKMAQAIDLVSQKTNGNAIIVSDVGQNQMMAARYYKFNKNKSHITSGGLGTMGFALPAAIGAKVAKMDREVICVVGDGGIQMNIQELAVILQEKLPVKILLLNNNYLGMVRQWQELFYEERYSFVDLVSPDFVKLAEAYSIKSSRCNSHATLGQEIDKMLNSNEAYLLEVIVEKQEKVFPMVPAGAGVDEIRLS